MKYRIFHISAMFPQDGETELNAFCASHRVASVDKALIQDGANSYWSFCIGYEAGTEKSPLPRQGRVDYKEVLDEADFALFARLRIDHAILLDLLARRFKGRDGLALLARILDSYHTQPGKGLPIGTLTSQHFANFYLDGLDRFLLETLGVQAQVRYMDDILWWCKNRLEARSQLAAVREFVFAHRRLAVKANPQINRSPRGVTFCGFRILPGALRLSRRRRQCYQRGRARWEAAWLRGEISARQLQAGYAAIHSIVVHGDTQGWRREQLLRFPAPEV